MKKNNCIELIFENKTLDSIAGFDYGKEIYDTQVKNKFIEGDINTIVFPSSIERIAMSFIQGFSKELIKNIGRTRFLEEIKIEGNKKLEEKFYRVI